MKRKKVVMAFCCLAAGVLLPSGLFIFMQSIQPQDYAFVRYIAPRTVVREGVYDVRFNSYYLAGMVNDTVYLGNYTKTNRVLKLSPQRDTIPLTYDFPSLNLVQAGMKVTVDDHGFHFADGLSSLLLHFRFGQMKDPLLQYTAVPFHRFAVLDEYRAALRQYDEQRKRNVLRMSSSNGGDEYLPEKQIDGLFCTDGLLKYSAATRQLIYTFFYRNKFLVFDTTMHLTSIYKTIDPVERAQIKVATLADGTTMLASPPLLVNKNMSVDEGLLYVQSGLRARNEDAPTSDVTSVIDVYTLNNGGYRFSFYLPDLGTHKVKDFQVHDRFLAAIYDHYVVIYRLEQEEIVRDFR